MNKCQLAIIPSSTISYEACSVKMLILGGYYVDNQKRINEGLDLNGMIYNVGDFRELKAEDFKQNGNKNVLTHLLQEKLGFQW